GRDHPLTATTVDNLGLLMLGDARFAEAESLFQRARLARERALGPDDPSVATSWEHLGQLRIETGSGDPRVPLERALEIRIRALGPEHPTVVETRAALGKADIEIGEFAAGRLLLRDALPAYERLGGSPTTTANILYELARAENALDNRSEAERLARRALAI